MIKLIHGADFHLDSPFSGLTPEQAARRREEQRQLLDDLAGLVRDKGADLVLLSGDLLDSGRVYRETAQAMIQVLGSLPCPVFLAPGNHDPYTPDSVYATLEWPENVHIFRPGPMQSVDLPGLNCTVYGRAFGSAHEGTSPLADFVPPPPDGQLHLLCLHGDLAPNSPYGPLTPLELAGCGMDYAALGHVHQASGLQRSGSTFWAYPGCPQGRGFDELGEKGVLYVEVEPGNVTAQFCPLSRWVYRERTVDVTSVSALEAILSALPQDTQNEICRITLTGQWANPDLPALEGALAGRFAALTLRDRTRLPQDLWARREEDTLTGAFLRLMWEKCRAEPEDQTLQLAVRFGLAALENGEDIAL